jgi:hypothetical protein
MKRKVILSLIVAALLMTPSAAGAAGKTTPTTEELKARAAEARAKGKKVVVKLRAGTKVLVGDKAWPFEFIRSASVSGRVKEVRENDFTLSDTSAATGEVTTVISYPDVLGIKHPSEFLKTLKAVGKYSLLGPAAVAFMPVYIIAALLGHVPSC